MAEKEYYRFILLLSLLIALHGFSAPQRIAILGGSGFVGQELCKLIASEDCNTEVVAFSRRGAPSSKGVESERIKYISCDCADNESLASAIKLNGPFDAYFHCIGLLLDVDSGLSSLNRFASGSGSQPNTDSTYDRITRQTAFNAIVIAESGRKKAPVPFAFVSAAEAGWTYPAPVSWLERYLIAKRAVEDRLQTSTGVREIVIRPSLIWTKERPQALVSVLPFYVGNAIGLPFVDKPVLVQDLVRAAWEAIGDDFVQGILRYPEIESLSTRR